MTVTLKLRVEGANGHEVQTRVIYGGSIKSRKGINLPDSNVSAPSLTEKRRERLILWVGAERRLDRALFLCERQRIFHGLREIIKSKGKDIKIIAKIEKPEALKNIDGIIEATDGLMVGPG